jgi:hypothetical protein
MKTGIEIRKDIKAMLPKASRKTLNRIASYVIRVRNNAATHAFSL